jgi:hypothetical protein
MFCFQYGFPIYRTNFNAIKVSENDCYIMRTFPNLFLIVFPSVFMATVAEIHLCVHKIFSKVMEYVTINTDSRFRYTDI